MNRNILPPAIEPAELVWHDGVPESRQFGDIYFSRDNGLEETRYVFIERNNLPSRFAQLPEAGCFVVAESGFGTGLNFLATWREWERQQPHHTATLHFISAERFPMTRADLKRALLPWPELGDLADELISHYPPLVRGTHRLVLAGGRVRLTLFFGDIQHALANLNFTADAWFLDGFAPSVNPGMWQETIIQKIREHSKPGTTLATFTAVGAIRRALADTGFRMQKCNGFGRKRDMLTGVYQPESAVCAPAAGTKVAVVGAGIAGCLLARNLAQRGYKVTLVDARDHAGAAASGNLQGATYVKLGVDFNRQTELALSSLTFSQRYYAPYRDRFWHPTGLLQLAWNESEQDRQRRFAERNQYPTTLLRPVTRSEAETLTGVATQSGGLWFPGSGWLEPARLCESVSLHPDIRRVFGFEVTSVSRADEGQWRLSGTGSNRTPIYADSIAICGGHLSPQLLPGDTGWRFRTIRGQVTHLPETLTENLKAVICGSRYLNPPAAQPGAGLSVTGASFDLRQNNPAPTLESHQENLQALSALVPELLPANTVRELAGRAPAHLEGRVAFRCTTHDYQPVAGVFCNPDGQEKNGLYLLTGLGSKGLTYAPLLAEFVADLITRQPQALPDYLARMLNTRRMHQSKKTGLPSA